jgi:hypothetical protein
VSGFDVTPSQLYTVSDGVADQQQTLDSGAKDLIGKLRAYPNCGGYGSAAEAFSQRYTEMGDLYFRVWERSVVGVGGAAVGFTTTADHFRAADAATDPTPGASATPRPLPHVIRTPPHYGSVPGLGWRDDEDAESFFSSLLDGVEGAVLFVLRPLLKDIYRWGKAADVVPEPNPQALEHLSRLWFDSSTAISGVDGALTSLVSGITDQHNGEWYQAMRQYCSSLWGTTAWGHRQGAYRWSHDEAYGASSHPVMAVLFDTAQDLAEALSAFAAAAESLHQDLWRIYRKALIGAIHDIETHPDFSGLKALAKSVFGMGEEVGIDLTKRLDTEALDAAVEEYNNRVHRQTAKLAGLEGPLNEARISAPTFNAEEARSEGFGARALNDFSPSVLYTVPGADNHTYPVDLAGQEGMHRSHVIDKHVGEDTRQLAQRLRDQQSIPSASAFDNLDDAQKYTQETMDDRDNEEKIKAWLRRQSRVHNDRSTLKLPADFPGTVTGHTITRAGYDKDGMNARAQPTNGAEVVLRYRTGGHPPYIVLTAMPTN